MTPEPFSEFTGAQADGQSIPIQVGPRGVDGQRGRCSLLLRGPGRTGLAVAFLTPEEADDLGFALMTYGRQAMAERDAEL